MVAWSFVLIIASPVVFRRSSGINLVISGVVRSHCWNCFSLQLSLLSSCLLFVDSSNDETDRPRIRPVRLVGYFRKQSFHSH